MTPGDKKPKADGSRSRGASPRGGHKYRLKRMREESLKPPLAQHPRAEKEQSENFALDCGWGRLVFAQTFNDLETLSSSLREEKPDRRDIAIYVRDPHVLLANAPQEMFLDPSHTYRLQFSGYRASKRLPKGFLYPATDVATGCYRNQPYLCILQHDTGPARFFLVQAGCAFHHLFCGRG